MAEATLTDVPGLDNEPIAAKLLPKFNIPKVKCRIIAKGAYTSQQEEVKITLTVETLEPMVDTAGDTHGSGQQMVIYYKYRAGNNPNTTLQQIAKDQDKLVRLCAEAGLIKLGSGQGITNEVLGRLVFKEVNVSCVLGRTGYQNNDIIGLVK
jgi:hypothetical protein